MKKISRTFISRSRNTLDQSTAVVANAITSDAGQGIAEYLIILAVVVIAAIALATSFSGELSALWESITSQLSAIA